MGIRVKGGQWKLIGRVGVLSRWHRRNCENCVARNDKTVSFELNYSDTNKGQIDKNDLRAFVVRNDPLEGKKRTDPIVLFSGDRGQPQTQLIIHAFPISD